MQRSNFLGTGKALIKFANFQISFYRVPRAFERRTAKERAVKCCPAAQRHVPNVVYTQYTPVLRYPKNSCLKKINTSIQFEPEYRPALVWMQLSQLTFAMVVVGMEATVVASKG